jgi:ectoine hydroxylase-related dioxygenase (phytanoyl-CoA dioxygenase family)
MDDFPIDTGALEDLVSRTVGRRVGLMPVPDRPPSFLIRVVRPRSTDHSPPHRDHWLDHLRGTIAAYLPVVGSGPDSSLPLVPGSHRWPDDMLLRTDGPGVANGVRYGIPAIAASDRRIRMQRPDPGGGELLVFSPYLVHGGAVNRQPDTTRVSLELRFEEPR